MLGFGNKDATAFHVSSSVIQLGDLHNASKTFAGVSIATTGIPDWTAEQTRKAVSNAIEQKKNRQAALDKEKPIGKFSPFSRNICLVCFRCLRESPGSTSRTSGIGPDGLDRTGPCEFSKRVVPDVSASTRFCSRICSWSHGTSSGLETTIERKFVTTLLRITELNDQPSYSVPLRILLILNAG